MINKKVWTAAIASQDLSSLFLATCNNYKSLGIFGALNSDSLHKKKAALLQLAEYERTGLDGAMNRIEEEIKGHRGNATVAKSGRRNLMIWKMFCDVTDLYGQIYCVKDIASRMK